MYSIARDTGGRRRSKGEGNKKLNSIAGAYKYIYVTYTYSGRLDFQFSMARICILQHISIVFIHAVCSKALMRFPLFFCSPCHSLLLTHPLAQSLWSFLSLSPTPFRSISISYFVFICHIYQRAAAPTQKSSPAVLYP